MFKLSSRYKLAIALGVALLAVIVTITLLATDALTQNMREALGRQEHLRARLIAERLDGMLDARRLALALVTEALPGPERRTPSSMHDAMAEQRTLTGAFLHIALFTKSGEMVYSAHPPTATNFVASTRPYFIEAVLRKREVLSQPFISTFSGGPVVVLARPVLDGAGDVDYVLAASIPLDGAPLASDPEDDERLYYAMTTEGYLISHPQLARITHHVNELPELRAAAAVGLQGFQGWRHSDGTDKVDIFARLKRAPWIVGMQAQDSVVFRSFTTAHDRLVLAGTALSAAALLAAWLVSLLVRQPEEPESTLDRPAAGSVLRQAASAALGLGTADAKANALASASAPSPAPSSAPSSAPSFAPSFAPSSALSSAPSSAPSPAPALATSVAPASASSSTPSSAPSPHTAWLSAPPPETTTSLPADPAARAAAPSLDLDAFMLQNFTTDEQRRSFISTVAASLRKLLADAASVSANLQSAPALLHTLKGAWGSLGATSFANAAGELEAAIKQQRPTGDALASFLHEATTLQTQIAPWLATREAAATAAASSQSAQAAPASPSTPAATTHLPATAAQDGAVAPEALLPLLKERNINASTIYETNRAYWNAQLGDQAAAFSAAMDALDFSTAERLLTDAQQASESAQRS